MVVVSAHWESVSASSLFRRWPGTHFSASSASASHASWTLSTGAETEFVGLQNNGPTVTSWQGPRDLLFDYYNFPKVRAIL